ncbi:MULTISPECIES: methyl-accepting chemotaxis protein [Comamonas]|uniref:methyl-accepting chemotaxis protein n=1 Tax=Comamonas TaxID=283 RepID=UPI00257EBD9A|nr:MULTISPECIES: methyl-accepting chemotaxis protein [Comamonas]
MQFKNLTVAKKVWLLLLTVITTMLLSGLGMTSYLKSVDQRVMDSILDMEERIRLVVQLRGNTQATASYLVAANMAQDTTSIDFFNQQFKTASVEANALLTETNQRVESAEGLAVMARLADQRKKLQQLTEQIAMERRNDGDVGRMVQSELVPTVDQYMDILDELVALQQKMLSTAIQKGKAEGELAMTVGGIALALVIALGLLLSAWLVRQLTAPLARAVELAETIAAGDLTKDVHDDRQDELGQLLRSLNAMTQKLRSLVGEVRNGVDSVSSAASQIATGNQDLSARTEQTAANLEETAASMEELTATVTQSADTARQANQLAATAVQAAERGGDVVGQVVTSMDQINVASRKINDIIGVIDGIAFQTNILALNAAVEAARAGEQGRGFAVVAGEVRSLAGRSAEAAKEIKVLITESVNKVDVGSAQVAQAGESMQEIVSSVRRVTDLIGEITASSHEQRDGIAQVNHAVSNLDQMTQQNAALVEESSAAATSMNEQAKRLAEVVAVFNVGQSLAVAAARQPVVARATASKPAATQAATKPAVTGSQPAARKPVAKKVEEAPKLLRAVPADSKAAATTSDDDWETF